MFTIGTKCMAQWKNGQWYPGTVTQVQYFVQFDDGDTAWVQENQIQPQTGAPMTKGAGMAGMGAMGGMAGMGGMPMGKAGMYHPGQKVQAMWGSSWYGAVIDQVGADGRFHVTYEDGYKDWLTPDKIRPI
jgi:hypothetical protein